MWSLKGSLRRSRGRVSHSVGTPIRPPSDAVMLCVAFVVGLFICCVSAVANAFLFAMHGGQPAVQLLMKFDAAGGIVAILLVWRLLRWSRERNQLIRERAEIVVQLNHEIRNAIQTISLHDYIGNDLTTIAQSVTRIERALDQYVPNDPSILKFWRAGRFDA